MNSVKDIMVPVVAVFAGLLACGCLSVDPYYVSVPTEGVATRDYTGEELVAVATDMTEKELIQERRSTGYVLVGRADFVGSCHNDWVDAMVDKGREIKAERVDYRSWYLRTDTSVGITTVPMVRTSVATAMGPDGPYPVMLTTTDNITVPYNYHVDYNQYHVYYFKRAL